MYDYKPRLFIDAVGTGVKFYLFNTATDSYEVEEFYGAIFGKAWYAATTLSLWLFKIFLSVVPSILVCGDVSSTDEDKATFLCGIWLPQGVFYL